MVLNLETLLRSVEETKKQKDEALSAKRKASHQWAKCQKEDMTKEERTYWETAEAYDRASEAYDKVLDQLRDCPELIVDSKTIEQMELSICKEVDRSFFIWDEFSATAETVTLHGWLDFKGDGKNPDDDLNGSSEDIYDVLKEKFSDFDFEVESYLSKHVRLGDIYPQADVFITIRKEER